MSAPTRPSDKVRPTGQVGSFLARLCLARPTLGPVLTGALVFLVLCFTLGDMGLTWDEPPGIERQHAVHNWLGRLTGRPHLRAEAFTAAGRPIDCNCPACTAAARSHAAPFDREALNLGWPFARGAPDEHPPVYAILSYITWRMTQPLLGPLRAHRLAAAVMLALTAGVLFRLLAHRWGTLPAFVGVAALVANPRLFAHAHLATTDVIMASFWFLAAVAYLVTTETGRMPWLFAVLAGLALMSKITGALVFIPLIVWSILYRRPRTVRTLAWALLLVPIVMVAVHPAWWPVPSDPLGPFHGIAAWYNALIHHNQRVPVFFLGRLYDYRTSFLPWYNPLLLIAITVPLSLLLPAVLGTTRSLVDCAARLLFRPLRTHHSSLITHHHSLGTWALLNFSTLILLRALTPMPGHDGLRQLVAALPFFAVLTAYGVHLVLRSLKDSALRIPFSAVILALVALPAVFSTARTHPYQLSYYNILAGGTRGAEHLGMETTYYWDAVTTGVIGWLNENLPHGATLVAAPPPDVRTFAWYQRWGQLRTDLTVVQFDQWYRSGRPGGVYIILQAREGLIRTYAPMGLPGIARSRAVFESAPSSLGVRVLAVFRL